MPSHFVTEYNNTNSKDRNSERLQWKSRTEKRNNYLTNIDYLKRLAQNQMKTLNIRTGSLNNFKLAANQNDLEQTAVVFLLSNSTCIGN